MRLGDICSVLQALSAECDKLNSFKEEFLEGKLSDRFVIRPAA